MTLKTLKSIALSCPTDHKGKMFILSSSESKINALNFNCLIYLRFSWLIMIWFQNVQDFKFGMPIVNCENIHYWDILGKSFFINGFIFNSLTLITKKWQDFNFS